MENRETTFFGSQKIDPIVVDCVNTIGGGEALVFSTLELDLRKVELEIQVEMVVEFTMPAIYNRSVA